MVPSPPLAPLAPLVPLVFLDFDGVLNSADFQAREIARAKALGKKARFWDVLDPLAVARLNHILKVTGAEVVVSSSWRLYEDSGTVELLQEVLEKHGFVGRVISTTPDLGTCAHGDLSCDVAHRGSEILAWLNTHEPASTRPFIILDDNADMAPLGERLIQTTWAMGLRDEHLDLAISMLTPRKM